MLPGSHLRRTTYGPGLLGSPNNTACSLVPAAFLIHLISDGVWNSTAVRSISAARTDGVATIIPRTTRVSIRNIVAMSPPCEMNWYDYIIPGLGRFAIRTAIDR